jgi:hypothetical protein
MVRLLAVCVTFVVCSAATAKEFVYQGAWNTTNRKLDGVVSCVLMPVAKHELQARFYGTWQGAPFDYTVRFVGSPSDLRGRATIDGASYECRAWINRDRFKANLAANDTPALSI